MLQKSIVLSDETFHQTFFSSYKAFVNIGSRFFNVAFLDSIRKKYIYLASEKNNDDWDIATLQTLLKKHYLTNEIPDIRIIVSNQLAHILPESFQQEGQQSELFNFVYGDKEFKDVFHAKSELNTLIEFSIDPIIKKILEELPQCKLYHHANALLGLSSWMERKFSYKSSVYIHLYDSYFEIVVKKNNLLKLFNFYTYQNNDDILYYIHWIIKHFELDIKQNTFVVSGWIDKKNELIKKMKDFDITVEWAKLNPQNIYSYRFNELQSHQFATLFSLPYENN